MWGDSSWWSWFAFPWWLVTLNSFSCICWSFVCLLKYIQKTYKWCLFFLLFLIGFLFLSLLSWRLTPYQIHDFSHSVGCLFIVLMGSFPLQNLFSFTLIIPLIYFCFCGLWFCCQIQKKKTLLRLMSRSWVPIFSPRTFMVSDLIL